MRRPLRITLKNTFEGTLKDLVNISLIIITSPYVHYSHKYSTIWCLSLFVFFVAYKLNSICCYEVSWSNGQIIKHFTFNTSRNYSHIPVVSRLPVLPQTSTLVVGRRVTWWEASVSFSRVPSRQSSPATWTRCSGSMPKIPGRTGNTRTLPSIWSHHWRLKRRRRRYWWLLSQEDCWRFSC